MLQLSFLGSPQISLDGKSLSDQITGKGLALLAYLAVTGKTQTRDKLVDLLWRDMSTDQARKNLRGILPLLRKVIGSHLNIERQTVLFDCKQPYWLDVEVFRTQVVANSNQTNPQILHEILNLYQGEFLAGFHVRNAPYFEEWVSQQRQELHALAVQGLQGLADCYLQQADYTAGLATTKRLLELDPWHETAHRQQMLLLAHAGQQKAALAQYAICQRILAEDLDVEPSAETQTLYEQILRGELVVGSREVGSKEVGSRSVGRGDAEQATPFRPPRLPAYALQPMMWGEIPAASNFVGRQYELNLLQKWLLVDQCQLVAILGMGGHGKSSLVKQFLQRFITRPPGNVPQMPDSTAASSTRFDQVVWCSLATAPSFAHVVRHVLQQLSGQRIAALPWQVDEQVALLIHQLRSHRVLIILDNLECVMQVEGRAGRYHPGAEPYAKFFHLLLETTHQSSVMITSRERPVDFTRLEESTPAVRCLQIEGLSAAEGAEFLRAQGIVGPAAVMAALARRYSGNPLALMTVAETVHELFAGNVEKFIAAGIFVFDEIRDLLEQQFRRSSPAEQEIMIWLALIRTPLLFQDLFEYLMVSEPKRVYLEAERSMLRRSLLEQRENAFVLPNLVQEFVREHFIDLIYQEVVKADARPLESHSLLNRYSLLIPEAEQALPDYTQPLLLQQLANRLSVRFGLIEANRHLQNLLDSLELQPATPGYAAVNLRHLISCLETSLQGNSPDLHSRHTADAWNISKSYLPLQTPFWSVISASHVRAQQELIPVTVK